MGDGKDKERRKRAAKGIFICSRRLVATVPWQESEVKAVDHKICGRVAK